MLNCPDFSCCRVVIVGDVMLDRYWQGDVSRISPEAPVPVVGIEMVEDRVGGAANVALNLSALGVSTTLVGVVGNDEAGITLTRLLSEKKIRCEWIEAQNIRTTLKLRVMGRHQQLIRLDFEDKRSWPATSVLEKLKLVLDNADVLILSDYAKGVLSDPQPIIRYARKQGIKVLVDPKRSDLQAYKGAHCLTPNWHEFETAVGSCADDQALNEKGKALLETLQLEALLVTRGSQGMTLFEKEQTTHIKAQAREVFDVTGAGDTVIAILAAMLAAKQPMRESAQFANIGAGIVVGKLGTATVSKEELTHSEKGILSYQGLREEVKMRKKKGHKIVMTNGCFDVLHAGHVTYLKQARALGDCLIVAVNDDDSVKRLKGETRPVNTLIHRLQVLAELQCVDYVVPFSDDTPENLIADILPDILVKGGDYTPSQIAGAKQVIANGGEIKIIDLVPGCSTTRTLEKLRESEDVV